MASSESGGLPLKWWQKYCRGASQSARHARDRAAAAGAKELEARAESARRRAWRVSKSANIEYISRTADEVYETADEIRREAIGWAKEQSNVPRIDEVTGMIVASDRGICAGDWTESWQDPRPSHEDEVSAYELVGRVELFLAQWRNARAAEAVRQHIDDPERPIANLCREVGCGTNAFYDCRRALRRQIRKEIGDDHS